MHRTNPYAGTAVNMNRPNNRNRSSVESGIATPNVFSRISSFNRVVRWDIGLESAIHIITAF